MPADIRERLLDAAARPSRDVPLPLIEQRLRRRRRGRRGGAALVVLFGLCGLGVLLTGNDESSVTTMPAAARVSYGGVSVELPDGWVQSTVVPLNEAGYPYELLSVGTASLPPGANLESCPGQGAPASAALVIIAEYAGTVPERDPILGFRVAGNTRPRPVDFGEIPAIGGGPCDQGTPDTTTGHVFIYVVQEAGRTFRAQVAIGTNAPHELSVQAMAVLNSLRVEGGPVPEPPIVISPPSTVPPSTVPPSLETAAIDAAFNTWIDTQPRDNPAIAAVIEDYDSIKGAIQEAAAIAPLPLEGYHGRVDAIIRVGDSDADLIYSILNGDSVVLNSPGRAVKIDGVWKVSRETVCAALAVGGTQCPPRSG